MNSLVKFKFSDMQVIGQKSISYRLIILYFFVCASHAASHHPADFLEAIKGSKEEGLEIYKHFCSNCHAKKPLIPLGAPRYRIPKDWDCRLKQDIEVLFQHSDEGLNAMPPRGGCFECSDYQLILALVTMLPKDAQKDILIKLLGYKKIKK